MNITDNCEEFQVYKPMPILMDINVSSFNPFIGFTIYYAFTKKYYKSIVVIVERGEIIIKNNYVSNLDSEWMIENKNHHLYISEKMFKGTWNYIGLYDSIPKSNNGPKMKQKMLSNTSLAEGFITKLCLSIENYQKDGYIKNHIDMRKFVRAFIREYNELFYPYGK